MIVALHPSLQVQQDDTLRLLRLGWVGGRATATLREAAMRFIERGIEVGSQRVLFDLSALFDLPVYDQLWLSATLLPRALRIPVQQVAVILPERATYNRQVLEFLLRQYQNMRRVMSLPPCDVQFFTHIDEGLDWITDSSPSVFNLQAQWHAAQAPTLSGSTLLK